MANVAVWSFDVVVDAPRRMRWACAFHFAHNSECAAPGWIQRREHARSARDRCNVHEPAFESRVVATVRPVLLPLRDPTRHVLFQVGSSITGARSPCTGPGAPWPAC